LEDGDLGLEWELEERRGDLELALDMGEDDDLGIRTGVDMFLKNG